MLQRITVEGTITPSTFLAAGARRTVTRTAFVEKLISKGFIRVVDEPAVVESQPVTEEETATEVPARNAKREVWAAFLTRLDPDIHFTDEDGRDDLIALYESRG
ncbi:hypothetical protein [Rhodococcus rhodochrous]|uniref:hypothetical protein n=1 Tax=Rhodococcus rhodochrous TaxID=1829 RepID=UPI0002F14BD6|nr:hypothetical protein [Rhodococcus rhodochrous]